MQGGGLRQDPRDKPSELQYVMLKIVFNHDPTIKLLKWPQPKKGKTTQPSLCLIHIYIYICVCVCVCLEWSPGIPFRYVLEPLLFFKRNKQKKHIIMDAPSWIIHPRIPYLMIHLPTPRRQEKKLTAPWGLPRRSPTLVLTGPCAA